MKVTYIDTTHSASVNPTKLDSNSVGDGSTQNRVVKNMIVGKPAAALTIILYHIDNAVFGNTTNIAFKYTYPTFGAGTPASDQFKFVNGDQVGQSQVDGMVLSEGGSVSTSAACQLTVLWDVPEA